MTVPTPPNTAEIAGFVRRVVDDELIGLAIHDANGDELDNTLVAYIIADVVMAVPSVASALTLRQAERDVLDLAKKQHPPSCSRYGHWHALGAQTEADRPERYNDPRIFRSDCADEQCHNPDCVQHRRCTNGWHDMDEALARLRAVVDENPQ